MCFAFVAQSGSHKFEMENIYQEYLNVMKEFSEIKVLSVDIKDKLMY